MAIKSAIQAVTQVPGNKSVQYEKLVTLEFDVENPRFGRSAGQKRSQVEILDYIVSAFGVDDVLSSIAVNGFFMAEPLICRKQAKGTKLTVVEGNRRLAACLILANDPRAKNQTRKHEQYNEVRKQSKRAAFSEVPVIIFGLKESEKDLLSYLGVRHIAASQGWDSYAKAAWIAKVVERGELTLAEIALMTGDQHQTVRRLLDGYYFINQLIDQGKFLPETSTRAGRGSNKFFPFSWVYTLMGYPSARAYAGMPEQPKCNPVPAARMRNASTLVVSMFGDSSKGRSAAIQDSREIGDLAAVLGDQQKVALLEAGKNVAEIEFQTQPIEFKLRDGLNDCLEILADLVAAVEASPPDPALALAQLAVVKKVNNLSVALGRRLQTIQSGLEEI